MVCGKNVCVCSKKAKSAEGKKVKGKGNQEACEVSVQVAVSAMGVAGGRQWQMQITGRTTTNPDPRTWSPYYSPTDPENPFPTKPNPTKDHPDPRSHPIKGDLH